MIDSSYLTHECYWCGKPILPNEASMMINVAPDAASGGTMMPHHSDCAPFKTIITMVPNLDRPPRKMLL